MSSLKKGADSWAEPCYSVLGQSKLTFPLITLHTVSQLLMFKEMEQLPLPDLISLVGWGPCGMTDRGCWHLDQVVMKGPNLKASSRLTSS